MRMHTKNLKKILTFLTLSALIITLPGSVYSYAADEPDSTTSKIILPRTVDGDEINTVDENDESTEADNTPSSAESGDGSDNSQTTVKSEEQTTGSSDSGQKPAPQNEQYDITKPVIEKVVFDQQGKTLKKNDVITLKIYAYDADSSITNINAYVCSEEGSFTPFTSWSPSETEKNCYICTYTLTDAFVEKIYISDIRIEDACQNYSTWETYGEQEGTYGPLYWALVDQENLSDLRVKSFHFEQNGQTIDENTPLSLSLETAGELNSTEIRVTFENKNDSHRSIRLHLDDSSNNLYSTNWETMSAYDEDGHWTLKQIFAISDVFGKQTELSMENKENYSFILKKTEEAPVTPREDNEAPVITGVELEKNGEFVEAGNSIQVTVSATDNAALSKNGSLDFYAASDITYRYKTIDLTYDENDQKYHGNFFIEEDTYPCEWYILSIYIRDEAGNYADYEPYTYSAQFPYYILVRNTNTFTTPAYDITVNFFALNEDGAFDNVMTAEKKNVDRRSTLKEAGIEFPEMNSKYSDFKQIGWEDYHGNKISEDTPIIESTYLSIYAVYDKNRFNITYNYPNTEGKWNSVTQPIYFESGNTYGDVFKKAQEYTPDNISKEYTFDGWDLDSYHSEDEVIPSSSCDEYFTLTARFSGKTALRVNRVYYTETGYRTSLNEPELFAVNEGTTVAGVIEYLNGLEAPKMYPGLKFAGWERYMYNDIPDEIVQNGDIIYLSAAYENCLVRYFIDPMFSYYLPGTNSDDMECEAIFCEAAEKGASLTFPESLEGYNTITWVGDHPQPGDSFTVNDSITFYGFPGEPSDRPVKPTEPTDPSEPDKPTDDNPSVPNDPETPGNTQELPEEKLNTIVEQIKEMESGALTITMDGATVVPAKILETAKDKDVTLNLDMGGYTWTINGTDISAANLQDINMQVILDTKNIQSSTIRALAGDNPTRQLSLAHEGDFGFKATLTVNMGTEYAGRYGNLYYHDSAGKLVFIDAGTIAPNGNVSLEFSHASDYVIVMSDQSAENPAKPGKPSRPSAPGAGGSGNGNGSGSGNSTNTPPSVNTMPNPTLTPAETTPVSNQTATAGTAQAAENNTQSQTKSVKTGDSTAALPWIACSISALGIMVYLMKKRKSF